MFLCRQNSRIARCHISARLGTSFPEKNSLLLVTFLKKFGLIWNFLFQFFFHWKDTCTKSCLKSKWSGSNSTVKKFKHLLWIQKKKKSMVIAWIASDGTLIAEHFFFRAITGYPLISTFVGLIYQQNSWLSKNVHANFPKRDEYQIGY